jgi:hypothetical protein
MSAPELFCILAAIVLIPLAFVPFLVEAGEKAGIVKTGQSGDDR